MLPLVGDLAPLHKRATALSIVVSGLLLGMLIARLLSGILTQYTSWRSIYWFSFGVQYLIFSLLFFFMPDYPSTNPGGLNYFSMLFSIVKMVFKHPVLVQACLVGFLVSSTFTSYWTTLTFLLSSPPYSYNSVTIGLFALIGIGAMCFGPFYSKAIIDRFVPLFSVILGLIYCIIGVIIGTYIGFCHRSGSANIPDRKQISNLRHRAEGQKSSQHSLYGVGLLWTVDGYSSWK
jgi:MFS family permease